MNNKLSRLPTRFLCNSTIPLSWTLSSVVSLPAVRNLASAISALSLGELFLHQCLSPSPNPSLLCASQIIILLLQQACTLRHSHFYYHSLSGQFSFISKGKFRMTTRWFFSPHYSEILFILIMRKAGSKPNKMILKGLVEAAETA